MDRRTLGRRIGRWVVNRQERRLQRDESTSVIAGLKRRETAISLIQTTVRYVAYLAAMLVLLSQLSGGMLTTVAGASVLVVLIGFAAQRFLTDILSGLFMVFEGWYAVGDTVVVEPWGVAGVVEEFSLRSTRLRSLDPDPVRLSAGAFVPPGREWLAGDLIQSLLHERGNALVVHGPVVTEVDVAATARFQRATSLSRAAGSRAGG